MDWNTLDQQVAKLGGVDNDGTVMVTAGDLREIKRGWDYDTDRGESLDGQVHSLIATSKVNAEMGRHLATAISGLQEMNAELVTRLIFGAGSMPDALAGLDQAIGEDPPEGVMTDDDILGRHLARLARVHAGWSVATFGPHEVRGPMGPLRHMLKEVQEAIDSDGKDRGEYADLLLLLLDATRRAGLSPIELVEAAMDKLDVNMERSWPDWRMADPNDSIEHHRRVEMPKTPPERGCRGDADQ